MCLFQYWKAKTFTKVYVLNQYCDVGTEDTHKNESRKSYQINTLSTLGVRALGKERHVSLKVFAILNLGKPLNHVQQTKNIEKLVEKFNDVTDSNMEMAPKEVHSISNNSIYIKSGASFDCAWNSRGWQVKEGIVTAIAQQTEKIINTVRKTNHCRDCLKNKSLETIMK